MERYDPRNPESRSEPQRPFEQGGQGWQEQDEEAVRQQHVNPLWPPDARPSMGSRSRPPQQYEGRHAQRSPDSARKPQEGEGPYSRNQSGGAGYPLGRPPYSDAGAHGRSGNPNQHTSQPNAGKYPSERTYQQSADPRAPGREGGRTMPYGPGANSAPSGRGGSWGSSGQPNAGFDDQTRPLNPSMDDHGRGVRRGAANASLHTMEAEPWASRPVTKQRSNRTRGIKGWWARHATTRLRRVVIITLLVALLLCSVSSVVSGVVAASAGQNAYHQATSGLAHLRNGEKLLLSLSGAGFSVATVQRARGEFVAGQNDFAQVNGTLRQIPSAVESAPFAGGKLHTVMALSSIATNFSQIGITTCDGLVILIGAFSNPFGSSVGGSNSTTSSATSSSTAPPLGGLTPSDLVTIQTKVATVSALLNDTTAQINALQPGDLSFDPKIGSELTKVKASLPLIKQGLQETQAILGVAGTVLGVGAPVNYLVEMLDSTELRPGGGFIGNIGVMTVNHALLTGLHVQDVDLLDRPFEFAGGFIPFPSQYQWFPLVSNWSVRDSNLDADFPTDAKNAETNYHLEGGNTQVQGVIAITPWLIEKALAITGPIYVPEFKETVTPANLVNLIHYHQLGPGHGSDYIPDPTSLSSQRKRFTAFLFVHFMTRVKAILSAKRAEFVKMLWSSLATKDTQVYFNDQAAEQILRQHSLASAIDAPATGDSLFVVDANVIADKVNNFVKYTMHDTVTIDQNGTATHQLALTYFWPQSAANAANNYGSMYFYRDYLRVYVPPQAQLIAQSGWDYRGQSHTFGRSVFSGYFALNYGASQTITLTWKVSSAAAKVGSSWAYQELIQRQAGNTWSASMQIKLPACGHVTSVTTPWQIGSGATGATLKGYLNADKSYTTAYTCAGGA